MLKFLNKLIKPLHLRLVKIPAYALAAEAASKQAADSTSDTSTEGSSK